jgi:hypothetical protein
MTPRTALAALTTLAFVVAAWTALADIRHASMVS